MRRKNQRKSGVKRKRSAALIRGVDLFCGAGGLTRGLRVAGIDVRLGVDIDPACEFPYAANNVASFLLKRVEEVTARDVSDAYGDGFLKLLAGCAPCQPFSTYSQANPCLGDERWNLLEHLLRIIKETRPHLVTMENVPPLEREDVFANFVAGLEGEGFDVFRAIVNCADYGVPQRRRRLVVLASKLGPIKLIPPTTPEGRRVTVRKAIGDMPRLVAGEVREDDPLHQACELSPLNIRRIRSSRPGGTWRDWDESLRASCHQKKSGKTYPSVYGRMTWDAPSPTMTTQYYGFGNGRFGHPEQDRAISLREGALLQGFPKTYQFVPPNEVIYRKHIGRLVGNAVPVKLGAAIGKSIVRNVENWLDSQERAA